MRSKVDTAEYWIADAIRNLRYAAKLADKPETATFADLKAAVFAAWQAIQIAEDLGAQMLKPLAGYISRDLRMEEQCSPIC